jgi:hypothetical protein
MDWAFSTTSILHRNDKLALKRPFLPQHLYIIRLFINMSLPKTLRAVHTVMRFSSNTPNILFWQKRNLWLGIALLFSKTNICYDATDTLISWSKTGFSKNEFGI